MDSWLSQVKLRQLSGDGAGFASLLNPDPTSQSFQLLRQSLQVRVMTRACKDTTLTA